MTILIFLAGVYVGVGCAVAALNTMFRGPWRLAVIPLWPLAWLLALLSSGDQ